MCVIFLGSFPLITESQVNGAHPVILDFIQKFKTKATWWSAED